MENKGKYYITTAIAYTSGKPHIGNVYEIVLADSIARYKRMVGYDVFFQTGTDEHGQKIEDKAKKAGIDPQTYVDNVAGIIKEQFECMKSIVMIYNKSKHEINSDVKRSMSFAPIDAIVFYLVARKLTMDLLMPYYDSIYHDFGDRLQYFHVNYKFERGFGFVE